MKTTLKRRNLLIRLLIPINVISGKHDIAERFFHNYKELFNSVHYNDGGMDFVQNALKQMKRGKSEGIMDYHPII